MSIDTEVSECRGVGIVSRSGVEVSSQGSSWEKVRTFCGRPPKRGDGSASYCYYAAWLCFFNTDGKRTCNPHTRLSFNFCRKQIGSLRRKPAETGGATSAARRQRQLDRRWRPSSIGSFPVPTEQVVTRGTSVIMSMLYEAESATATSDRTPPPRWVSQHMHMQMHLSRF